MSAEAEWLQGLAVAALTFVLGVTVGFALMSLAASTLQPDARMCRCPSVDGGFQ